jgi:putative oxidoreductase
MIAGILVPLVSLGFIVILLSAMYLLKAQSGFVNGYELELLLAVISLGVGISHFDKKIVQFIPTK